MTIETIAYISVKRNVLEELRSSDIDILEALEEEVKVEMYHSR